MDRSKPEVVVEHAEAEGRGAFFIAREGIRLAEMTYSRVDDKLVIIDHTEVDAALQGRGVARKLLDAAVAWARRTSTKLMVTCSYAKAQFDKDASIRDVLAA